MPTKKIDKNTNIQTLLDDNPEMNDVLYEYGLYCGNCFAAGFDTLEEGARTHGLEDEEIDELIKALNQREVTTSAQDERQNANDQKES